MSKDVSVYLVCGVPVHRVDFFQRGNEIKVCSDCGRNLKLVWNYCPTCGGKTTTERVSAPTKPFARWAAEVGISPVTLYQRLVHEGRLISAAALQYNNDAVSAILSGKQQSNMLLCTHLKKVSPLCPLDFSAIAYTVLEEKKQQLQQLAAKLDIPGRTPGLYCQLRWDIA